MKILQYYQILFVLGDILKTRFNEIKKFWNRYCSILDNIRFHAYENNGIYVTYTFKYFRKQRCLFVFLLSLSSLPSHQNTKYYGDPISRKKKFRYKHPAALVQ